MTSTARPSPVRPAEAIAWHKDRVPLTDHAHQALAHRAQKRAFTVAGAAQADLVAEVQEAITQALVEGTALEAFKAAVGDSLRAAWIGTAVDPPTRLELIFRNNVQSAYNAGRYVQATDPETRAVRPFWQYDAVRDGRTTQGCKLADGVVLPADDPWWQRNMPPRHHQCRATFHPLTEAQASRYGVTASAPPISGQDGFGQPPTD